MNLNALIRRAEQAYAHGSWEQARSALQNAKAAGGGGATFFHFMALVEKKLGNAEEAKAAFLKALAAAPDDPSVNTDFGNLLADLGHLDEALSRYDTALLSLSSFAEGYYNRALLLGRLGRLEEALDDLRSAEKYGVTGARLHSAKANLLRQEGRLAEAAEEYDRALRDEPNRFTALHGRARIAMERGEKEAPLFYQRALMQKRGDPELVLGLAEALEAEGDPTGMELLSEAVARDPNWISAHEVLTRMKSEAGYSGDVVDHYQSSLEQAPHNHALHFSYWRILMAALRYEEALKALQDAPRVVKDISSTKLVEALLLAETGDIEGSARLLNCLDENDSAVLLAQSRARLRAGRVKEAAHILQELTQQAPDHINAWAHLGLAWRLLGDARHDWLCDERLFGTSYIGLDSNELERTAELLRGLHRTRAHPIGQSLRGGTQTRGRLFSRDEPEIQQLRTAIATAVNDYFASLPPYNESHPLLRHRRSRLKIAGSWSVRLVSQGFHVNHIHPEGILSSACYISVPSSIRKTADQEGWLEIGSPPTELQLGLPPLRLIQPEAGRLALFPSYLFHGTRPFASGERLTVAFDAVPE